MSKQRINKRKEIRLKIKEKWLKMDRKKKETEEFNESLYANTLKRVSDVLPPREKAYPDTAEVSLRSILDTDIEIEDYTVVTTRFGEAAVIKFRDIDPRDTQIYSVLCGGMVVLEKLAKLTEFPIIGKIIREKNYYDLT